MENTENKIIYASVGHAAYAKAMGCLSMVNPVEPKVRELAKGFFDHIRIKDRLMRAPASTKRQFHHAFEGGLIVHSVDVFETACRALSDTFADLTLESGMPSTWDMLMVALLHDIHKIGDPTGVDYYIPNYNKAKPGQPAPRSEAIPFASNDEAYKYASHLPTGATAGAAEMMRVQGAWMLERCMDQIPGGEVSLGLVRAVSPEFFATLSDDVLFAIRHHDGAYGPARRDLSGNETPLMLLMHFADMVSSRRGKWIEDSKKV